MVRRQDRTTTQPGVLVVVFVAMVVVIVGTAGVLYARHRHAVKEFRYRDLQSAARLMAERITLWRRSHEVLARTVATGAAGIAARYRYDVARAELRDEVRGWLGSITRTEARVAAHMYDTRGRRVAHADTGPCPTDPDSAGLAIRTAQTGSPGWSGLRPYGRRLRRLEVSAPVLNGSGVPIGAVVLDVDATQGLFRMFDAWQPSTRTLEALLVMPSDGCVVALRSGAGPPRPRTTTPTEPDLSDFMIVRALDGRLGHLRGVIGRNRLVYGYITVVDGTDWRLIVRENGDEADAPLRAFGRLWIAIVLASVTAAFGVVFAVWRGQRATHYRALYEAEIEQRRAETALYRSRALLQLVLDHVPLRVFWKDKDLRYLGCNQPFANDAGYDAPDDVIGQDDYAMKWRPDAEQYRADDRRVIETGEPKLGYVEPQTRADGSLMWLRTSKVPLRDEDERVIGVLGTYEDITGQVAAQEQLMATSEELAERNKELAGVLSAVSHDLRAPLVNISGFGSEVQAVLGELRDALAGVALPEGVGERVQRVIADEMPHALTTIVSSANRMSRLLNGVLTISRVGRAELSFQPVQMSELVQQVVAEYEYQVREQGVAIEVGPLPNCEGDAVHLARVFENLIGNALKYREPSRQLRVQITGRVQQGYAAYCVEDNGIGIAPEHQERIFELFERVGGGSREGDGIGLTTVRAIVARHGGRVWVEATLGEGSRFFVRLPRGATLERRKWRGHRPMHDDDEPTATEEG